MNIISNTTNETMTSLKLLEVINKYRLEDGKVKKEHDNFMKAIADELEGDAVKFNAVYKAGNGEQRKCYNLPKDECMLMAMRESKLVHRKTVEHIKNLEAGKPQVSIEMQRFNDACVNAENREKLGSVVGKALNDRKKGKALESAELKESLDDLQFKLPLSVELVGKK